MAKTPTERTAVQVVINRPVAERYVFVFVRMLCIISVRIRSAQLHELASLGSDMNHFLSWNVPARE